MADLSAIRAALADNLSTIPDVQITGYAPSMSMLPAIVIFSDETQFHGALQDGKNDLNLIVRVMVASVTDIGAQTNLDEYRAITGARSIKAAIEADQTLGGACSDLKVAGIGRDTAYVLDGSSPALGCEFNVEITI